MKSTYVSWEEAVIRLRGQKDGEKLVRDCFYDDPLVDAARRYHESTEWLAIQQLLTGVPQGNALDVGAGRGISSYALARDGWQVTALEPDTSSLVGAGAIRQLAIDTQLQIAVVEEECERLPFADETFQLVFIRQALHHANDLSQFCREAARVLKPGGVMLAVREHVISSRTDLATFRDNHPLHGLYGGENAYLLDEYLSAFKAAGLSLTTILAPFDSDINLYPENREQVKKRVENKLGVQLPKLIFQKIVTPLLNFRDKTPGRLYSFMGVKQ